ncbi:MAG: redoxin domain-containing protein [Clostridia bacterium]|nr:redoxin domain-containing protein [Clostridia bacterium]
MKLTLRKGVFATLVTIMLLCLSFGLAACDSCGDEEHNFSEEWSYDDVAHWHACLDEDCDEVSDYEEHIPADEGSPNGGYVYYTCEVCGDEYRSDLYTYFVYVKNIGGAGVSGVSVTLYNQSGTALSTISSGSSGAVRFRNLEAGNYTAKINESTIPIGYSYDSAEDLTIEFTADYRTETFTLTPHLITEATMPSGTVYSLGSVVYDFEVTAYYHDGSSGTIKLSEYLEKYNAVVIQFWYTTCSPCLSEFPYMNQTYNSTTTSYYQKIGLIEFAYTAHDNLEYFQNFIQGSNGYDNFTYVYDTGNYYANYNVGYFPTTVVIDKYGVVAQIDVSSNPSYTYWNSLFEYYSADDYVPNYASSSTDSSSEDSSALIPDVDMPESGEIANAIVTTNSLTTKDTFEFSAYTEDGYLDIYSWPWLVSDGTAVSGVTNYIYTSNANKLGTYAILVIDVRLEAGQTFMFDYLLATEEDGDYFYVQVNTIKDGNVIDSCLEAKLSGTTSDWTTFYYPAQQSGYYQITLTYSKNTSVDEEGDKVYVSNMCLNTTTDVITSSTVVANADILYNAATYYSIDGDQYNYYPGVGYRNYVSVYLASDGYYHVNYNNSTAKTDGDDPDDDDPYLLADLMYVTIWNSDFSIWNIAEAYLYSSDEEYSSTGVVSETYTLNNGANTTYTVPANSYYTFTAGSGSVITLSSTNAASGSDLHDSSKLLSGESLTCTIYLKAGDVVTMTSGADGSTVAISTSGKGYLYDELAVLSASGQEASSYAQAIEDYSWVQNNCDWGYVPVDETLAEILKEVTYSYGTDSQHSNSNQWLEVCRYYIHYGKSHTDCASVENLAAGYGIRMAVDKGEAGDGKDLSFHANVEKAVLPRGFYYSFTATTEGVYYIYTDVPYNTADGTSVSGDAGVNPMLWITDKNGYGISENDNYDLTVYDKNGNVNTSSTATAYYNDNAYMYVYLKAGETYLIVCAMSYSEDTGEYDVYVHYLGATYSLFAPAATGDIYTYSYDESTETYTYYIPATYENIRVNDDGTYSVQNYNGEWTALYINMTGITYLNSSYKSYTIEQELSRGDDCYWTGTSYETMCDYLYDAQNNTDTAEDGTSLTGYVRADTTLVTLLNYYINGGTASTVSDYSDNAWIMTAYYVRVIDTYRSDSYRIIDTIS